MKLLVVLIACICGTAALAGVGLVEFTCDGLVVFEGVRSVKTSGIHGRATSLALEAGTWRVGARAFEVENGEILRLGELTGKNSQPSHAVKPTAKSGKVRVTAAEKVEWRIWGEDVWRKGSGEATPSPGACRLEWRENETIQQRLVIVDEAQPLVLTLPQMIEVLIEPTTEDQVFVGPKREGAYRLGDVAVLVNKKPDIVSWKRLEKAAEKISRIIEPTMPLVSLDPLAMATKTAPFRNSLGMAFVPAGTPKVLFNMWETRVKDFEAFVEDSGHDAINENAYGATAFTLESGAEWKQAGGSWRSPHFKNKINGQHAVVCVSYLDAEAFCLWLTNKERTMSLIPSDATYRLPTDDEWSRACGENEYPWGDYFPPKKDDGNYLGKEGLVDCYKSYINDLSESGFTDSDPRIADVGSYKSNKFGLFDVGGNALEWCSTWFSDGLINSDNYKKPYFKGVKSGQTCRVLRGGSWGLDMRERLKSSFRGFADPRSRNSNCGFRCILDLGK